MSDWPQQETITDPAAVRMLADLRALRYLTPFLRAEHTLTSAAAVLDRAPSTLAYWIPRFVRVGLLVELGVARRAGMAMPRYRAPAGQLVVPFRALPFDRRVALLDGGRMRMLRQFLDGLDEAIERDDSLALGFSSDAPHSFAIEMVETSGHRRSRPYIDGWMSMQLTASDAHDLAQELESLVERYRARNASTTRGARRHLVHVGVAPDPRVRWRSAADEVLPG